LIKNRNTRILSESTIFTLRKLLLSAIEGEKQIERSRRTLNSKPYFSSYSNFELIKNKLLSYINYEDLSDFLLVNGLNLGKFEVDLLFKRLDKNRDYQITFNEFVQELIPSQNF
jgi:hypothetical protein